MHAPMHTCTHTHTVNNELLAVMGKHTEQSYTQQHTYNLYLCVSEKQRESSKVGGGGECIYVLNYRFASTCAQIHRGNCLLLKCQEASNIQQHLRAEFLYFPPAGWNQQGCKNQLLSIKSPSHSVNVPSSHSKSCFNYLHPPIPTLPSDTRTQALKALSINIKRNLVSSSIYKFLLIGLL